MEYKNVLAAKTFVFHVRRGSMLKNKTPEYLKMYKIILTWNHGFWETVCKTVRPMLSVRCPVCLPVCL